jgi:hypothetical protein
MIANNRVSAVLVSTDLARSQEFYENKVGLKLSPKTIKRQSSSGWLAPWPPAFAALRRDLGLLPSSQSYPVRRRWHAP